MNTNQPTRQTDIQTDGGTVEIYLKINQNCRKITPFVLFVNRQNNWDLKFILLSEFPFFFLFCFLSAFLWCLKREAHTLNV